MKLNFATKAKKPNSNEDREDRVPSASVKRPGWMMADAESQNAALEQQRSMSGKNRPPEMWLSDGDEKQVRFRDPAPIACLWRYSVKIQGKWTRYTQPDTDNGEEDLFASELNLRPSLCAVYEVIDIAGYTSTKTGKTLKNIPRFLVVNTRLYEQLQKIGQKRGPLPGYNVEICRTGQSTQTLYTAMAESPSPMRPEWKVALRLKPDFQRYYAPPSAIEMDAIVRMASRSVRD